MGEMASLWGYAEHHDMEQLGEKLLCTTLELEKLKAETKEEMLKNKEYVKQLTHLLKFAIQERDEARNQLQKILNQTTSLMTTKAFPTGLHYQLDHSPFVKPAKANSSVTESNSLSETHNHQSHSSPPVESLLEAVSSPEFSNINFAVNEPTIDQGSLIIDSLVSGRALPHKGKFLQAVLEAGPLLQTLMVSGSLPRWRNPPQLQPSHMPPVLMKGCDAEVIAPKPTLSIGQLAFRQQNSQPYYTQMSCGPMSNLANVASGSVVSSNVSMLHSGISSNGCVPLLKRQRFC